MLENTRRKVVIARPPEPKIKPAPVIPRTPQPQPRQRQVAVAPPKTRKPREKRPLVITITCLHVPDPETGNDVIFSRSGTAPSDIDVDALEQYVADFFGNADEEYDEEYEDEYEDLEE